MTDEQINEAITQATGLWDYPYSSETKRMYDFCSDLNAMHEAEKVLMQNGNWRMGEYEARLFHSVEEINNVSLYFHATAHQRAEAFLRTLGKWEEVQN